ncbi:MAG: hypothetical protein P1V51_06200 [Deltaproteobacteria bacterium]|nr:hypothetical protein [Deltaproteobacteria bacterium]
MVGRGSRHAAFIAVALLSLAPPAAALAASFRLEARSEAFLSSLPAWPTRHDEVVLLGRDPLSLRLDLFGAELVAGQQLDLVSSLRLGTDLGWRLGEAEALDGADRHRAEALLLSLRWRLPRLGLELQVGRQLELAAVRPRYFDGAHLRWRWSWLEVESFAGLSVKDGSLLGPSTFEADGVRSSDAALAGRVDEAAWPFVLTEEHAAPTLLVGTGAGVAHPRHGRLLAGVEQASSAGSVDHRLFTLQGEGHLHGGHLGTALAWDLVQAELELLDLQLGWRLAGAGRLSVFHRRSRPTFDGDSIWNLFVRGDRDTTGVSWRSPPSRRLRGGLSFHDTRLSDPVQATAEHVLGLRAHLGYGASARLRLQASGTLESGGSGTRGYLVLGGRARLDRRLGAQVDLAAGWLDDPGRLQGLVLGSRSGLTYRFDESARAGLALELNHSPLSRLDLRVLGRLEVGLDVFWGGRE